MCMKDTHHHLGHPGFDPWEISWPTGRVILTFEDLSMEGATEQAIKGGAVYTSLTSYQKGFAFDEFSLLVFFLEGL